MLTETLPEIEVLAETMGDDFRSPLIRCPQADFYQRAEKKGLLIGFYEQDCKTWGLDGIDPNFANALCPDDLDRVVDVMEGAFHRIPCLETAGIHSVINGPITYTPDGLPLVGKIPGKRNAYCITGLRAGLGEGGGHGWLLAQIIAHGEACYDTWCLDPRRFTQHATQEFTALKAIEDYQNEFRFHMPHEHRPAGRLAKVTPLYSTLKAANAEFAPVNGWERLDYIKPSEDFEETHSFHFNNVDDLVVKEVELVQTKVGLTEVNGFNRYEIIGTDIHDWLDGIMCSRVPRKTGKVGLTYFLNEHGNVKGEATIANFEDGRVWYGSAAASEYHDMDWLREHLPADNDIQIKSLTNEYTILVLAGPKARDVLAKAALRSDVSKAAFPWLSLRKLMIGQVPVVTMSVSFSGELAYELHVPNAQLLLVHDLIMQAGQAFDIGYFGLRAVESMRLEKGYMHWKTDLITEFNPFETGLDRFVKIDKGFIGKEALQRMHNEGPRREFVCLELHSDITPAYSGDSIMKDGKVVGTVTSSGWGHRLKKNLAYAFLEPEAKDNLTALVVGQEIPVSITDMGLYDPDNALLK